MCQKINKQDKKVYTQDLNTTNLRRNRNALFMLRKKIKKRDNLYRKIKIKKYNEHKNAWVKNTNWYYIKILKESKM